MTNQTIEQAVEEVFQEVMSDVGKYYRVSDSLSDILSDSLGERLTKALQAQRDAGYQQCLLEIKHEQRKLLDGFGHPKDCAMCLTPPTK